MSKVSFEFRGVDPRIDRLNAVAAEVAKAHGCTVSQTTDMFGNKTYVLVPIGADKHNIIPLRRGDGPYQPGGAAA
ncbi:MAG: hypothetical protein Q8Q73_19145 [Stagnimonas sp.]|nr:hypothetical protein [Stagnimonas sp.]